MDKDMRITDLLSVKNLQLIQDAFSEIGHVTVSICDKDGVRVTKRSIPSEFCTEYVNKSSIGRARCEECHKHCREMAIEQKQTVIYQCHMGLYGFAAPIFADGKLVGSITGGRVILEQLDEDRVLEYISELGVDTEGCIDALRKVRCIEKKDIESISKFMYQMSAIISNMAYDRYRLVCAKDEVERAAKMKSDFLANMSHEIRTPMNAVIGMAEMALRENLPEVARQYIGQIISSGKTLLTIINDILDFTKIDAGMMMIEEEEYEIMSLVNDIANVINTRIGDKDVELILDIHPQMPRVIKGDINRLKQVIINLSNNAIKFTKEGQVVLKIDFKRKSAGEMDMFVSVQDTGIGIKKEDLSKLFEAFQQLDSKRNRNIEGTGLGLAISKRILMLMNGQIWVESEYGKGSTFSFSVPQKIVNEASFVSIESPEKIIAAGLIANGFLRKHMEKDMEHLEVNYISIDSENDLEGMKEKNVQYFFIEQGMFSKKVEQFVKQHSDIQAILMIDFRSEFKSEIANLVVVKKPMYVFNMALLFNGEDITNSFVYTNADDFDFIAPNADILIVDDNVINLTVAEGLLKPLHMRIDKATSGKQAVEMVSAKRYDLVFMDHMMPEVDGVETTRVIRRFHPELADLPIIALTANAVNGTKEMFLEEGMNDFVAKPIEMRMMLSKLRTWLPKEKIEKVTGDVENKLDIADEVIMISGLDTRYALNLVGSNKLYWVILKEFYHAIEKKTLLIKELEIKEDWELYTIEVHALKSVARQIGALVLGEQAARLENAGKDKDVEFIHNNTDQMLEEYCRYIDILRPYFEQRLKEEIVLKVVTTKVLLNYFEEIRMALEELELDKVEEIVGQMSGYQYDGIYKEYFKELKEKVAKYDADGCEEILNKWESIIE